MNNEKKKFIKSLNSRFNAKILKLNEFKINIYRKHYPSKIYI